MALKDYLQNRKTIKSLLAKLLIFGLLLFALPKIFPQFFYKNSFQLENYTIHSNYLIDSSVIEIIDSVDLLLSNEFNDCKASEFDVFLCNSHFLFWAHSFLGKMPTGASDLMTNNIYIANTNIEKNFSFNFINKNATSGRSTHSVIAHESMHILLRKKFGFREYRKLVKHNNWKVEGFCEWISLSDIPFNYDQIQDILQSKSYLNNPYYRYRIYRVAVYFLIVNEHKNLNDLMTSRDSFEDVLQKYIHQKGMKTGV